MRLSVIIPVYNAAAFIDRCFRLIRENDLADTEVIFIDDGSRDNSLQQLQDFALGQDHIKVLTKPNGGAASARNMGIRSATGNYITFLDADDTVDFAALFQLLNFSFEQQIEVCGYRYNYIASGGEVVSNALVHPITYNTLGTGLSFLTQGYQPSSICVFLLQREFMIRNQLFFVEGITHEDVEVSLRYLLDAQRVYFSDLIIYNYYQNEGSVTNQVTQQKKESYLLDEVKIAGQMKENLLRYNRPEQQTAIRKNYNSVVWNLIYHMIKEKGTFSRPFRQEVIALLKQKQVYPIKGPLKTRFQRISRILMNVEFLVRRY